MRIRFVILAAVAALLLALALDHVVRVRPLMGIRAADQAYADAWLANDSARVMATLTRDALVWPSGTPTAYRRAEIREFWFPANAAPTTVTRFVLLPREVWREGGTAMVEGVFELEFDYDGTHYKRDGQYLSRMRKQDGKWKIAYRAWSDR